MKKKIIILAIIGLILIIGLVSFIFFNNSVASVITLDINPSIEISLMRNGRVKDIKALNNDAKDVINGIESKNLDDVIRSIRDRLIYKEFISEGNNSILLYTVGKVKSTDIEVKIRDIFNEAGVFSDVIIINEITNEDKELAQKYNISVSKAAYINAIIKDNDKIDIDILKDKSVNEMKETKETGKTCGVGYFLEGDWCYREVDRVLASEGYVCPGEYYEYNGMCYEEVGIIILDELECSDGDVLSGNKCVREHIIEAEAQYECATGELMRKGDINPIGAPDNDVMYCVDKSSGKAPVLRCLNNRGHIMINGKCYNGPAPIINGGCVGNDIIRNGGCYSLDDEDQWECPSGDIYSKKEGGVPELCPDTLSYIKPKIIGYTCPEDYTLKGEKCIKEEKYDAMNKSVCKSGYTMVDGGRCINMIKKVDKVNGLVCNSEHSKLKGNKCIIYEVIESE